MLTKPTTTGSCDGLACSLTIVAFPLTVPGNAGHPAGCGKSACACACDITTSRASPVGTRLVMCTLIMLTVRSAAKVPPASWPDGGCELDPISSKSLTKLPAPNWAAGRSIVVFGLTLFTGVPLTTRFLKADPAELKDELKAEACAVATARTTSAVTSPLTRLTPADSATPVSVAVFVVESTVLVLDALSTFAFKTLPPGGGTATFRTWLLLLVEPMPDCELQTPCVQVAGVAVGSVWLIPKSVSWTRAPIALPLALAPAGLKTVKLTGLTLVRSFSSALNDVEARVFIDTKRTFSQGIVPIVSLTLRASSPKRLVPVTVNPVMLAAVFTAASQRVP